MSVNDYDSAKAFIEAGRNEGHRKIGNNTYVVRRWSPTSTEPDYAIRLHSTDVVTYRSDGTIMLQTNGWQTPTTADRIRAFSPVWLSSWSVYEPGWENPIAFFDGITVDTHGRVLNAPAPAQIRMD